jgi:hypothetical protein
LTPTHRSLNRVGSGLALLVTAAVLAQADQQTQ